MTTLNEARPKVSVLMITYNHEAYIEQAVRSVMIQRVDFSVELVISDDASKDATPDILRRLQAEFPETIRLTLRERNIGMLPNFVDTYFQCSGEYIALLEGDDYWIDPDKLKFQVDFLQTHPRYVLIGTNAQVFDQTRQAMSGTRRSQTSAYDFDTALLMSRNPIPTCTAVLRNGLLTEFPSIYFKGNVGDRRLYLLLSQHGLGRFDPRVTAVYRVHNTSVTSGRRASLSVRKQALIDQIAESQRWIDFFDGRYHEQHDALVRENAFKVVRLSFYTRDFKTAFAWIPHAAGGNIRNPVRSIIFYTVRFLARL